MQFFLDGLLDQCERTRFNAELILVEWNPPQDKPRLREALHWQSNSSFCRTRIIEVNSKIHSGFQHSDELPLFQMIAKNAGIRRAGGQFILATNIDILFSNELMRYLSSRSLKKNRLYRIDRYDSPIPAGNTTEERIKDCREHVVRINRRDGSTNTVTNHFNEIYRSISRKEQFREVLRDYGWLPVVGRKRLHTNACGDFTLLSRDRWFTIRGYPEFEMYSFHLDSVLCFAAYHSGAREVVLKDPMRIYHMEHEHGWSPEREDNLNKTLSNKGIRRLEHSQMEAWAIQMRRERKPIIFNEGNWGLAAEDLPETFIG